MRGKLLCFILCLFAVNTLPGCLAPHSAPEELTHPTWRLVEYNNGKELAGTGPLTEIILTFGEDGKIFGNAGCNDYSGEYEPDGGLIEIRVLTATEKYCLAPEGVMEMEQKYLLLLQRTTRYSIEQDELTLSYYDQEKLLVFRKQ